MPTTGNSQEDTYNDNKNASSATTFLNVKCATTIQSVLITRLEIMIYDSA